MPARAAGANPLILRVMCLMLAQVKLQSGVWIYTQFKRSAPKPAGSLPVYFPPQSDTPSASIFHLFSKLLCPLYGSPRLAAQQCRGLKKKKPTSSKQGYKELILAMKALETLSVRHLSQSSRASRALCCIYHLAGRCSIKKTEVSSTENMRGGPQLMLQLQQKPTRVRATRVAPA